MARREEDLLGFSSRARHRPLVRSQGKGATGALVPLPRERRIATDPTAEASETRFQRERGDVREFFTGIPRGIIGIGKLIAPGAAEGEPGVSDVLSGLGRSLVTTGRHIVDPASAARAAGLYGDTPEDAHGTIAGTLLEDLSNVLGVVSLGAGAAAKGASIAGKVGAVSPATAARVSGAAQPFRTPLLTAGRKAGQGGMRAQLARGRGEELSLGQRALLPVGRLAGRRKGRSIGVEGLRTGAATQRAGSETRYMQMRQQAVERIMDRLNLSKSPDNFHLAKKIETEELQYRAGLEQLRERLPEAVRDRLPEPEFRRHPELTGDKRLNATLDEAINQRAAHEELLRREGYDPENYASEQRIELRNRATQTTERAQQVQVELNQVARRRAEMEAELLNQAGIPTQGPPREVSRQREMLGMELEQPGARLGVPGEGGGVPGARVVPDLVAGRRTTPGMFSGRAAGRRPVERTLTSADVGPTSQIPAGTRMTTMEDLPAERTGLPTTRRELKVRDELQKLADRQKALRERRDKLAREASEDITKMEGGVLDEALADPQFQPAVHEVRRAQEEIAALHAADEIDTPTRDQLLSELPQNNADVQRVMADVGFAAPPVFPRLAEKVVQVYSGRPRLQQPGPRTLPRRMKQTPSEKGRTGKSFFQDEGLDLTMDAEVAVAGQVGIKKALEQIVKAIEPYSIRARRGDPILNDPETLRYMEVWNPDGLSRTPFTRTVLNRDEHGEIVASTNKVIGDLLPEDEVILVPKSLANGLKGLEDPINGMASRYARAVDTITGPWITTALFLSPRWHAINTIGNAMLTAVEMGPRVLNPMVWHDAYRAFKRQVDLGEVPGTGERLTARVPSLDPRARPGGPFEQLAVPRDPQTAVGRGMRQAPVTRQGLEVLDTIVNKSTKWNKTVDDFFRTMVYRQNIKRAGVDADSVFDKVQRGESLTDAEKVASEQALRRATKALVDYEDMTVFDRGVLRRLFPFITWQKGILKLALSMPIDSPVRFMALEKIVSTFGQNARDDALPEWYRGGLPIGDSWLVTRSINPFADAPELANPKGIWDSLNPFIAGLVGQVGGPRERIELFGPQQPGRFGFPEPRRGFERIATELGRNVPLVSAGASALGQERAIPTGETGASRTIGTLSGLRFLPPERIGELQKREREQRRGIQMGLRRERGQRNRPLSQEQVERIRRLLRNEPRSTRQFTSPDVGQ